MSDWFKALLASWGREILFACPILLLIYTHVYGDEALSNGIIVGFTISIIGIWVAHLIRRIMIPTFSITKLYQKSLETPLSAAITLFSTFYLLSVIIQNVKLS